MAGQVAKPGESIFQAPPPAGGEVRRGPGRPPGSTNKPKVTPPAVRQRKGMENSLGLIYGMAGAGIESRGVTFYRQREDGEGFERVWQPSLAGRAMKLGSPSAGKELSDWINSIPFLAGILGPILGNDAFMTISKVAGLPLMLHLSQVRPDTVPMLRPLMMPLLAELFAGLKQMEREQAKALEALTSEKGNEEFEEFMAAIFTIPERVIPDEPEPVQPPDDFSGNGYSQGAGEGDPFASIDEDLGIG